MEGLCSKKGEIGSSSSSSSSSSIRLLGPFGAHLYMLGRPASAVCWCPHQGTAAGRRTAAHLRGTGDPKTPKPRRAPLSSSGLARLPVAPAAAHGVHTQQQGTHTGTAAWQMGRHITWSDYLVI
jgi:hypothetical protein